MYGNMGKVDKLSSLSPNVGVTTLQELLLAVGVSTAVLLTAGAVRYTTVEVGLITISLVHNSLGKAYREKGNSH